MANNVPTAALFSGTSRSCDDLIEAGKTLYVQQLQDFPLTVRHLRQISLVKISSRAADP